MAGEPMIACPACASDVPANGRFCSSCGTPLDPAELQATRAAAPPRASGPPSAARAGGPSPGGRGLASSDAVHQGRFLPGTVLGSRYRIVGLLGRGGMGEVHRADDLKLGQPVALKFLPEALAADAGRLERFFGEVRIARQIAHPNVCRVYDIGEIDGHHFISMEYVDGEDLASLLRRIGRLPSDKAVDIARQLCAGLAAAHDKGVLHRDLKPGNVMIDGRGKVRITDFGLAALASEVRGAEVRVGTPAYMAPEQLAGREVSVRSDVYALGLVLYETLTGRTGFDAATLADLARQHTETRPVTPSSLVSDLDPALERVIMRCLEKDPEDRPASVMAVAAALPGGDPLAAALAAGETPSPEMVAAAGDVGALGPRAAAACLAAALAGFAGLTVLTERARLLELAPAPKPPQVLQDRARQIAARLGYDDPAADWAHRMGSYGDYLRWVRRNDASPRRWDLLKTNRPPAILYWHRQSPRDLEPLNAAGVVSPTDPPLTVSGMTTVVLDPEGRLVEFERVPPQVDEAGGPAGEPDWSVLFAEAGLDMAAFTPSAPRWSPPVYADARAAWEGPCPGRPDVTLRVESAAYRGRPVYFESLGPWSRPAMMQPAEQPAALRVGQVINVVLVVVTLTGAGLLARRNLRLGRGDRRGAFRVAVFLLVVTEILFMLNAAHGTRLVREWNLFVVGFGLSMFVGGMAWVLYLALEPLVRRRWPASIISWSRLLAGRFRDPLVGRDVLVGTAAGVGIAAADYVPHLGAAWLGLTPPIPFAGNLGALMGPSDVLAGLLQGVVNAVIGSMFLLFFLAFGLAMSRGHWSAYAIFFAVTTLMNCLFNETGNLGLDIAAGLLLAGLLTAVYVRRGLLAAMAAQLVGGYNLPVTFDASAWYFPTCALGLAALAALAVYAFHTSLGGRPLIGGRLLQD